MLKIIQYGNPILEQKSKEVKDHKDPKVQTLIAEMLKVLDKEQDHSAGLSAPQVSELLRIAICRRTDLEERDNPESKKKKQKPVWEVMINPELIYKSPETSVNWEGCLSINYGDLFGRVPRARDVEVKFLTPEGETKTLKATGFFSHIIQHEIDHLDGILFLRYVKDPNDLYTGEEIY